GRRRRVLRQDEVGRQTDAVTVYRTLARRPRPRRAHSHHRRRSSPACGSARAAGAGTRPALRLKGASPVPAGTWTAVRRRSQRVPGIPRPFAPYRVPQLALVQTCARGSRFVRRSVILAISIALVAGCGPLRTWDAHTTSWPTPASLDLTNLTGE